MTEPSGSVPMPVFHDWTKRQRLSTITTTMTEYPWETLWTDLPIIGKVDNEDLLDDDYNTDIQKLKDEIKSINRILSCGGRIINEI